MKVLITGAAGFLGRHFARHHIEAGDTVFRVDDFSSPYASWPEGLGVIMKTDCLDLFKIPLKDWVDRAYHFAAPVGGRVKIEGDPMFNARSLALDSAFFRWAQQSEVPEVVYPSSSAVYGVGYQRHAGMPLMEGLFNPEALTWMVPDEMYGLTKLVGEYLAWKSGLDVLCIRPFSGYGEDQSFEYPMPAISRRAARHVDPLDVWGGEQRRDFIHVDDVVAATVKRMAAGVRGYVAMNIGSGVATSFNEIALMMARAAEYDPTIFNMKNMPQGVDTRYCDPTEMLKYHTPTVSLQRGIERMVDSHG